jgi:sirohydrochlorin cobaltochelatase
MTTALILFAHGARDPEWADPMRRVQAAIRKRDPALHVELAFLEFMSPTLDECLEAIISGGATRVVVQPMFIARGGHIKRDLPELIERLRGAWPKVEFTLNGVIGENESVIQAMAAAVMDGVGP